MLTYDTVQVRRAKTLAGRIVIWLGSRKPILRDVKCSLTVKWRLVAGVYDTHD